MSIAVPHRARRLTGALLATLAAAACGSALTASGASALTQVTCNGINDITYSPALTNTVATRTITEQATFSTCLSATHPALHSATIGPITTTGQASCLIPLGTYSATATVNWNTGQTSTLTGNVVTTLLEGESVSVLTGSVSSGLLAGSTVTEEVVLTGDPTACLGNGLTSNSGEAALTFVGL